MDSRLIERYHPSRWREDDNDDDDVVVVSLLAEQYCNNY